MRRLGAQTRFGQKTNQSIQFFFKKVNKLALTAAATACLLL